MTEFYENKAGKKSGTKAWQTDLAQTVVDEWKRGKQYVGELDHLADDLYAMLRGERPIKNYDWQSNLVLNKAFQVIWKAVSYTAKKVFGADPVIGVKGFNNKGCWQREMLLEKWMNKDAAFLKFVMGCVRLYLNGVVYIKKTWSQEFTGNQPFPSKDCPTDTVVNNADIVVDWMLLPGQSCREGRFVTHRQLLDASVLFSSKVNYINLDKINLTKGSAAGTQIKQDHSEKDSRDGLSDPPSSDLFRELEVMERQGVFPVKRKKNGDIIPVLDVEDLSDKDIEYVQMVATIVDPKKPVLIRWEENPYGEIGYIDGHLYYDPERWASLGMIEPIKDTMVAINDNINAVFDQIDQNLMPPAVFNKFAGIEWDTIQYAPQQKWMVAGDPNQAVAFTRPSNVTGDAWARHQLLDGEVQATTSITPAIEGMGKEKTATMGVLNAQFSTDKLDFMIMMIEQTWLRPSAMMNMRFAQMFGHQLTFLTILGEPFQFDKWKDEYNYNPVASSVKMDQQKEVEISQDLQIIQVLQGIPNPFTPKMINYFLADILRHRGVPKLEQMLDENYFEPGNNAGGGAPGGQGAGPGQPGMMGQGAVSNQNGVGMSVPERSVRQGAETPRGMLN